MSEPEVEPDVDLLAMLYVQTSRILDVMYLIAGEKGIDIDALVELHKSGGLMAPDPWLNISETPETDV